MREIVWMIMGAASFQLGMNLDKIIGFFNRKIQSRKRRKTASRKHQDFIKQIYSDYCPTNDWDDCFQITSDVSGGRKGIEREIVRFVEDKYENKVDEIYMAIDGTWYVRMKPFADEIEVGVVTGRMKEH